VLRKCTTYRAFLDENIANGGADSKGGRNDIIHRCEVTRPNHRTTMWPRHFRMYTGNCSVDQKTTCTLVRCMKLFRLARRVLLLNKLVVREP
jgi:hypothetical protein